ncbi:major facilitator superfamily domain-containing protein [Ilyonectria robusta]|uniref:major facilitator superfamily domain-containing protein n=1 Tax=Ilyonectria robusta TaxID=1079257 RepID=UPI001E8E048F|nr:major facilitator superfamily domain-containing protein [Ilyonectria robusta]KAH8675169.1 major facilitator superfamily domain-containing protein [Ilyonectria robusta]
MGFLGILEDKHLAHVPATVILNEQSAQSEGGTAGLKHGKGKESHIVLVPQPTADPNDPLNWSQPKKLVLISVISFGGIIMASVYSGLLNPGLGVIAVDLDRSINDIAVLSSYQLLTAGAAAFIVAACSRKWGKRPVFFFSSLLGTVGSIIGSCVSTYDGILAARIVQGIATAAYESILVSAIGDIYFVHQRGLYMSVVQFILAGVSNVAAVVCGPITDNLGWRYLFHLCVLFSGLQTLLVFFFVPETNYIREARYNTDEVADDNLEELAQAEKQASGSRHLEFSDKAEASDAPSPHPVIPAKKTYLQELALFSGTYCDENFLQLLIAPLAVCTNLAVLWSVVVSGGMTAFYVSQAMSIAQIFMAPPYLLSAAGIGYLSLGPFIGAMIGSIFMSIVTDPIIKWCAVKNKGIYEPEYRLLPVAGGLLVGVGLMSFGALAQDGKTYYATATMHGVTLAGVVIVAIAVGGYALDAYREMSDDVFVSMIIFKNFLFYGFSWFVNTWVGSSGPAHVFYVFGSLAFAMTVTAPLVFFFGKRYRSYWSRNNLLIKLHIKAHSQ